MDRRTKPSIQNSETAILTIPRTTDAWHNTTVHYRNRRLEIRLWSSTPPAGYKWRYPPVRISLQVIQQNRAKLRNIQLRTPRNNPCTHWMATLPHGIFIPGHCQVRSQKPDILPYCPETQLTTSTLESLSIWIRPESHPHPRHTDGAIRRIVPMRRPCPRHGQQQLWLNPPTRFTVCEYDRHQIKWPHKENQANGPCSPQHPCRTTRRRTLPYEIKPQRLAHRQWTSLLQKLMLHTRWPHSPP